MWSPRESLPSLPAVESQCGPEHRLVLPRRATGLLCVALAHLSAFREHCPRLPGRALRRVELAQHRKPQVRLRSVAASASSEGTGALALQTAASQLWLSWSTAFAATVGEVKSDAGSGAGAGPSAGRHQ